MSAVAPASETPEAEVSEASWGRSHQEQIDAVDSALYEAEWYEAARGRSRWMSDFEVERGP